MGTKSDYFRTVSEAVSDIAANGYDSDERLLEWTERLKLAAERSFKSLKDIEIYARRKMTGTFKRLIDDAGIVKKMPSVSRYTLHRVRPELQAELNRRIHASINLIKLNRPAAVQKTVSRFYGWATSVPPGGFPADVQKGTFKQSDVTADIKKSLKQLPFEERRVIVDQHAKLVNAINTTVALGNNAIAGKWRSHKDQPGYDGRPKHNERDGKIFLVRDSWAIQKGFVAKGSLEYTDEVEQPGEDVFCFSASTDIQLFDTARKAYRRWYSGKMAKVVMASGKSLTGTPNHPVLTTDGWRALGSLNEGDYVVEVADEVFSSVEFNSNYTKTKAVELFDTLSGFGSTVRVAGVKAHFHGDGVPDSNVDIVDIDWQLGSGLNANVQEPVDQDIFSEPNDLGSGCRSTQQFVSTGSKVRSGSTHILSELSTTSFSDTVHSDFIGLTLTTKFNSIFLQNTVNEGSACFKENTQRLSAFTSTVPVDNIPSAVITKTDLKLNPPVCTPFPDLNIENTIAYSVFDDGCANTNGVSDFLKTLPFKVQASCVIKVKQFAFSGHVYNFQTDSEAYIANGVIVHNCRCFWVWIFNLRDLPPKCLTKDGAAALKGVQSNAA